jgi:hypothetical protein
VPAVRDRSTVWRPAAASAAVAVAIGTVVLLSRRDALTLAAPPACAGALEALASLLSHASPSSPIASWIVWTNALVYLLSLAIFAAVASRLTRRRASPIAATAGLAMLPALSPVLAPFATAPIAAAGAVWLALLWPRDETAGAGRRREIGTWLACLLPALIEPRLTWPLAIAAGWRTASVLSAPLSTASAPRRGVWPAQVWLVGAASAVVFFLTSWLFQLALVPRLPPSLGGPAAACLLPMPAGLRQAADSVRWILSSAGGFATVLAALGWFSNARSLRRPTTWPLAAYALLPLLVVAWPDAEVLKLLGPSLVAFWVLVGLGLDEVIDACGSRPGGVIAAAALALALPGLQLLQRAERPRAALIRQGQEDLSRRDVERLLDEMPDGGVFVREDAYTDVLMRGSGQRRPPGRLLHVADRDDPALAERLRVSETPAFALPGAQTDLQFRGFALAPAALAGASGVANVRDGGTCRPLGPPWRVAPELAKASAFAVVALDDHSRDAVVVYVASDRPLDPKAIEWPGATTRGFLWDRYDLGDDANKGRLASAIAADQLRAQRIDTHRYVLRFVLQWMPDAPRVLAVGLGNAPDEAVARIDSSNPSRRVVLCPAYPFDRTRLSVPR